MTLAVHMTSVHSKTIWHFSLFFFGDDFDAILCILEEEEVGSVNCAEDG